MKKINTVKENFDFTHIIESNNCMKDYNLVVYYNQNDNPKYRFGISVGKKLGNAVLRNKYKRRIRNIIDHNKNLYQNNLDYIIMVRKNCLTQTFEQIENSFVKIMIKINNLKGEKNE